MKQNVIKISILEKYSTFRGRSPAEEDRIEQSSMEK